MMLNDDNIVNYYQTNVIVARKHGISITEIERMIPFERDIMLAVIRAQMAEEERLRQQQQNNNG